MTCSIKCIKKSRFKKETKKGLEKDTSKIKKVELINFEGN